MSQQKYKEGTVVLVPGVVVLLAASPDCGVEARQPRWLCRGASTSYSGALQLQI